MSNNIKPIDSKQTPVNMQRHCFNNHCFYDKNRGFTLIEALIGFLILSIGMLGIASLQAVSLKAGKSAVYGSVAMMKVEEIFESMRVNPTALVAYAAAGTGTDRDCTGANTCTPAELADDDVFWWNQNLTAGLPAVVTTTTTITLTATVLPSNMTNVAVTVNWRERNQDVGGGDNVARAYTAAASICVAVPC